MEHLSWLGLFKNMNVGTSQAFLDHRTSCTKTTDRYHQCVFERFTTMRSEFGAASFLAMI